MSPPRSPLRLSLSRTGRYSVALTLAAFVLNYLWEHLQCPLFVHRPDDAVMWIAMIVATLGDVVLTWIPQLVFALALRRWIWPDVSRNGSWVLLVLLAAVMAIALERYALATGRWSYASTNPLIPGLGVSVLPVAQLVLLVPISFVLAHRFAGPNQPRSTL